MLMKDFPFAEGFIAQLEAWFQRLPGAVDLTQIIGITVSIDGVNRLPGRSNSEWMKRGLPSERQITCLALSGGGTYTALTDPEVARIPMLLWIRQLIVLRRRGKPSGIRSPIWTYDGEA